MAIPALVFGALIDGEYDDDLDRLIQAIRERQKAKREKQSRLNALTIRAGTRIRLLGLTPKALNGRAGTVTEVTGKTFTVELEQPWRYGQKTVRVPAQCVEVA